MAEGCFSRRTAEALAYYHHNNKEDAMRKYRYSPESIAGRMNYQASQAVKNELDSALFLEPFEVLIIIKLLSMHDRYYYRQVKASWLWFYTLSKLCGCALVELDEEHITTIVHAIECHGDEREHFELLREMSRWFGFKRESAKLPYSPIPQDNRPGLYDDSYDGSTWYEFVDQTDPITERLLEEQEEQEEYDLAMSTW
jgi:hypothetical protein